MIGKILIGFQFGTINNDDLVTGDGNSNSSEVSAVTPFPRPLTRLTPLVSFSARPTLPLSVHDHRREKEGLLAVYTSRLFFSPRWGCGCGCGCGCVGCGVWGVGYGKGSGNEHAIAVGYMHKSSGNGTQRNISWRIYNF